MFSVSAPVPVINKTGSFFKRDPQNPTQLLPDLCSEFQHLLESEPSIVTLKTDGTCAIICELTDGQYFLMRRQDIKLNSRNYENVISFGEIANIGGRKCYVSQMIRGTGKSERKVPIYIFQLDETEKPELENNHVIGFTPLLHDFGDDKYAITAIKGRNGTPEMELYTTVFCGHLDIEVRSLPIAKIMGNNKLMTVEILGSKISNKYGFKDDRHCINPHGSVIYPSEQIPRFDLNSLKQWFENDETNRWANVEGLVVHFPQSNKRFKVHRGHVGLEKTWQKKKESGIRLTWVD